MEKEKAKLEASQKAKFIKDQQNTEKDALKKKLDKGASLIEKLKAQHEKQMKMKEQKHR